MPDFIQHVLDEGVHPTRHLQLEGKQGTTRSWHEHKNLQARHLRLAGGSGRGGGLVV